MPNVWGEIQKVNMPSDFDSLPVLKTFDGLERGDKVYSRKYGLGKVAELYRADEIIVNFSELRKRFAVSDQEIALIPEECLQKKTKRVEAFIGGEKVSFKEFKRRRDIERRRQKYEDDLRKMKEKDAKKKASKTVG